MESPRFDPDGALGWRDIALDGLNCYLRCVEAMLRRLGHSPAEVARALAGPVDLLRVARTGSELHGYAIEWHVNGDGWPALAATLRGGEPAVVMPDRYHWPGDEFEGERHFHDHTVLAFGLDDGELSVLDTDAPPEDGYVRRLELTPQLELACGRWGVLVPGEGSPARSLGEFMGGAAAPSVPLLATALPELRAFAARWRADGVDDRTARALHVAALGDFQPVLFLFAQALATYELDDRGARAQAAAAAAAAQAKSLGLLIIALERERSEEAYALAAGALERFVDAADELLTELVAFTAAPLPDEAEPPGLFERRLGELRDYCFAG